MALQFLAHSTKVVVFLIGLLEEAEIFTAWVGVLIASVTLHGSKSEDNFFVVVVRAG